MQRHHKTHLHKHDQRDDLSLILTAHIKSWMWHYTSIVQAVLGQERGRDRLPRSQQADSLEYTAQQQDKRNPAKKMASLGVLS